MNQPKPNAPNQLKRTFVRHKSNSHRRYTSVDETVQTAVKRVVATRRRKKKDWSIVLESFKIFKLFGMCEVI